MYEFFGCVAAALAAAAPVINNIGEILSGGRKIYGFACDVWDRYCKKVPPEQQQVVLRQALTQAAALPPAQFEANVSQAVAAALPNQSDEFRRAVVDYITLIPARVRATFSCPQDPSGTTVPAQWAAHRPDDLLPFLPPRPPLFRAGDTSPGAPNWKLVERLGIGGFGEVWKAQSQRMTKTFRAFKFCLDPISQGNLELEMENIELVQSELGDHPNIVKLIEVHFDSDAPWLQYEYVEGGELGSLVATWPDDVAVRASLAVQTLSTLADTLEFCHNRITLDGKPRALIHRDMKPANVLIGRNVTLKITDFGISNAQARQALEEARLATVAGVMVTTAAGEFVRAGTPMYASEQQLSGEKPHPSDDVHALGVMLYQMILGNVNRPLNRDWYHVLERRHVCGPLIEVLARSIASDRADRYQHAGELAEALRHLPKKLVVEPVSISQADLDKQLYEAIDEKAADARVRHEKARALLDERKWSEATGVLEGVFHPALRDEELYSRAVAHRDGKRFVNALGMEFVLVPKGTFWMGGENGTCGSRQVTIEDDFHIGVYPVTQEEWQKVMGSNPSYYQKGGTGADKLGGVADADIRRFPVECVSWQQCQEFIRKLNEKMKESGWMYRLPREAEWEYSCRGAAISQEDCAWNYYFKAPSNTLSPLQANFSDSNLGRPSKVGLYPPNALGIHDMHGNVWEWCEDLYSSDGPNRVDRGGSWYSSAKDCRAAYRGHPGPANCGSALGLRLARVPVRG